MTAGGMSLREFSVKGIAVQSAGARCVASIRHFDANGSFVAGLAEVLGCNFPGVGDAVAAAVDDLILAWRSPTEALMLVGDARRIESAAGYATGRSDGCVVDQTGGFEVLSVTGARGPDLMVRLGSPSSIPAVGESRTSRMAEVSVTAFCVRSGETLLLVERVYAAHLLGWIRSTLADF